MNFEKYHGLGNDYLVYDAVDNPTELTEDEIKLICHRNFGIGSDGILYGPIKKDGKIALKILNPDGSEAEKSGNGVRIFSKYLKDKKYVLDDEFDLDTLGGRVHVKFNNEDGTNLTVSMGQLKFTKEDVGAIDVPDETVGIDLDFNNQTYKSTCVSIGNPHCVIPMDEVSKEKVCEIGKYSETAKYFPKRINTQIIQVLDEHNIKVEIFERGAGYTLASGSSSCAAAGAACKLGLTKSPVNVHMPGGILTIEIDDDFNVNMTGDVTYIGKMSMNI